MSSELLKKLQQSEKKVKKDLKSSLNPNSAFATLTDEEISMVLALRAKALRVTHHKKQKEFSSEAKLSSSTTYANFEQKGTISLINFIKVMRTFGRLEELEQLLQPSIKEKIEQIDVVRKQRVR